MSEDIKEYKVTGRFVTDWVDIIDTQTNEKYEPCLEKGLYKFLELVNGIVEERDVYKRLWEEMSYYFEEDMNLYDLDNDDFRRLQRLARMRD